jgi:ArsR family metal-binding transcriptional regulator
MNQDLVQKQDIGVVKNGNMIKLKDILKEETIDEKFSVQGMRAREIISTILTKTDFAAGDVKSQKEAKDMIDDLVKTLNNFYEKYNIDKKIIL